MPLLRPFHWARNLLTYDMRTRTCSMVDVVADEKTIVLDRCSWSPVVLVDKYCCATSDLAEPRSPTSITGRSARRDSTSRKYWDLAVSTVDTSAATDDDAVVASARRSK